MDLGPDPTDRDDIIQRYGRRLFVLAYHLTGDSAEAAELSQECLIRGLLAPDFPSGDREAGVFLHRGLISLWRERMEQPGRGAGLRIAGGAAGGGTTRAPREHAALWRALSRLDPVSRAVLVLRAAGGLEYETIGKVLDMAPDVVYARLLQARAGLREGDGALEASLFETMNLFLDGRLPGDQRGAFEMRMRTDAALRERVEFHRGLTLELHEEAPPLPREFAGKLRARLDLAQETLALVDQAAQAAGWEPPAQPARSAAPSPEGHRLSRWVAILAGAMGVLVIGVALGSWAARRRLSGPAPGAEPGQAGTSARPRTTPDEATIEALRSLGYLAPAKEQPRKAVGKPEKTPAGKTNEAVTPARTPRPAASPAARAPKPPAAPKKSPAPAVPGGSAAAPHVSPTAAPPSATPRPSARPSPSGAPAPAPSAAPEAPAPPAPAPTALPTPESAGTPPAPAAETPHQEPAVTWRVIPVGRAPETGREFQVFRTSQEWAAFFEGTGAPPPAVAFDGKMAVLLRSDLAGIPPSRLVVAAVRSTVEALLIECLRQQPGPDAAPAAPATAGQAVVMPISDLPIRVVVR